MTAGPRGARGARRPVGGSKGCRTVVSPGNSAIRGTRGARDGSACTHLDWDFEAIGPGYRGVFRCYGCAAEVGMLIDRTISAGTILTLVVGPRTEALVPGSHLVWVNRMILGFLASRGIVPHCVRHRSGSL